MVYVDYGSLHLHNSTVDHVVTYTYFSPTALITFRVRHSRSEVYV